MSAGEVIVTKKIVLIATAVEKYNVYPSFCDLLLLSCIRGSKPTRIPGEVVAHLLGVSPSFWQFVDTNPLENAVRECTASKECAPDSSNGRVFLPSGLVIH